ncbi:MAG: dsDNA-specific endonuclease/ATPase MutS2 [Bacillariaceae sp.]|jgi:dsDNA-specific endonuclease/ATPase MutS2
MKSFGLVSVLTKLGIPIPIKEGGKTPRVDYFDDIFVNVGDNQSVLDGESTWTSILNSCATMIQTIEEQQKENNNSSYLVLLDELGTGTDPASGGAVAQAILEELIEKSCKVVVTTHLPRLKTLSYNNNNIGCAAVLLDYSDPSTFSRPSFKLEYGIIGESHALNAASRCVPSLPDSVISRASDLMDDVANSEETGTHKSYIQALTRSMEEQLQRSKDATSSLEETVDESFKCRQAMVSLARSYECHLDRRLDSLEVSFQKLRNDKGSDLELIGNTLSELKIVKKKIVSQEQLLADNGLKVLPTDYVLNPDESIVIISNDKWEGMTANVVSDSSNGGAPLGQNEVLVRPSFSLHAWDDVVLTDIDPMADRSLILQRHEIAIWNLDSIYDDDDYQSKPATSISDSKRKINSLLSTLNSVSSKKESKPKKKLGNSVQSSRQRKAANKAKKKGK